ncbi:MAG: hypothetical protein ACUVR4_15200 [Anaerolineae bacterium]
MRKTPTGPHADPHPNSAPSAPDGHSHPNRRAGCIVFGNADRYRY